MKDPFGLHRHPTAVGPALLRAVLVSTVDGRRVELTIREVEAYAGVGDPASHSHHGPTPRCLTMFGEPGRLYVYRSYGVHWCANVVVEPAGVGSAVLLRGGSITVGVDVARDRRGRDDHLADGPGKLCQALGIDGTHDGLDLFDPGAPIRLVLGDAFTRHSIGSRVGITRATDLPWRFVARG